MKVWPAIHVASRTNLLAFVCFAMGYVINLLGRELLQQEIDHEFTP